jgi:hypothetical protein
MRVLLNLICLVVFVKLYSKNIDTLCITIIFLSNIYVTLPYVGNLF